MINIKKYCISFLCIIHVHVICNLWRLLLAPKRCTLWRVTFQQPVRSNVDKGISMATKRDTVAMDTSVCARFKSCKCRRAGLCEALMGTAGWSSTRPNTGSRGQGTATRETLSRSGAPLSKAHKAPFRDLQDMGVLFWRWSKVKLRKEHCQKF